MVQAILPSLLLLGIPFFGNGFGPSITLPRFRQQQTSLNIRVSDFSPDASNFNSKILPVKELNAFKEKLKQFDENNQRVNENRKLRDKYRGYVTRNRIMNSVLLAKHFKRKDELVQQIQPFKDTWKTLHLKFKPTEEYYDLCFESALIYRKAMIAADTLADLQLATVESYQKYIQVNEAKYQKLAEVYPGRSLNLLVFRNAWEKTDEQFKLSQSNEEFTIAQQEATAYRLALTVFEKMVDEDPNLWY